MTPFDSLLCWEPGIGAKFATNFSVDSNKSEYDGDFDIIWFVYSTYQQSRYAIYTPIVQFLIAIYIDFKAHDNFKDDNSLSVV